MLDHIRSTIRINILAPEYPGYGIYNKIKKKPEHGDVNEKILEDDLSAQNLLPSAEQIIQDTDCVYDFVLANFKKIREKDIVVFGRSMGSGPSIHLASTRNPCAVITMSAYTSIKNVVSEKMKLLGSFVAEHFNNLEKVKHIQPQTGVLLIHGKNDYLISWKQSKLLQENLNKDVTYELVTPERMSHNDFDFYMDLIRPIFQFFIKIDFETAPTRRIPSMQLDECFYLDQYYRKSPSHSKFNNQVEMYRKPLEPNQNAVQRMGLKFAQNEREQGSEGLKSSRERLSAFWSKQQFQSEPLEKQKKLVNTRSNLVNTFESSKI